MKFSMFFEILVFSFFIPTSREICIQTFLKIKGALMKLGLCREFPQI